MAWKVELDEAAEHELDKLDPQVARRILSFLFDRVAKLDDPRSIGESSRAPNWARSGSTAWATIGSSPASRTARCASWWCALAIDGRCIGDPRPEDRSTERDRFP